MEPGVRSSGRKKLPNEPEPGREETLRPRFLPFPAPKTGRHYHGDGCSVAVAGVGISAGLPHDGGDIVRISWTCYSFQAAMRSRAIVRVVKVESGLAGVLEPRSGDDPPACALETVRALLGHPHPDGRGMELRGALKAIHSGMLERFLERMERA